MDDKKYIDIKFINATSYYPLDHLSSGGTRAKRVLENSNGKQFFFKESEKKQATESKPEKHYIYEFFNEIIAYQLGKQLGLDMLRYDIAIFDGAIGCISPRMNNLEKGEQLIEFGKYMIAVNPDFNPESEQDKKYQNRKEYTFQLLEKSFDFFNHKQYMQFIFKVLIFDAIIGNVDRHQENWAFLSVPTLMRNMTEQFKELVIEENKPKVIQNFFKLLFKTNDPQELKKVANITNLYSSKIKKNCSNL